MPIDEVTLVRMCGECRSEIETFKVKKDNMFLFSEEQIWCPNCQAYKPEVRDVAGRQAAIQKEVASYPKLRPADPKRLRRNHR